MEKIKKGKCSQDIVTIFREVAKGMGRLRFHPHEAYEEELEERINPQHSFIYSNLPHITIHAATALIAGAETIYSEDGDFDEIRGLKRKWRK